MNIKAKQKKVNSIIRSNVRAEALKEMKGGQGTEIKWEKYSD